MADIKEEVNGVEKNENSVENIKNENDITVPEALAEKILKQVEYYFGDFNLPKDKFMLKQIKVDDGWIPMSVMLQFKRLAQLSTDPKVIAKSLETSNLIEVDESEGEIRIRRTPGAPLPEIDDERLKELQSKSIYCKGFPLDFTMNELLEFFNKYGEYENIVMRKYKDKLSKTFKFKGSVFVTFKTKEKAQEFLNIESVKCKETELIRLWQLQYIEKKKKEIMENKLKRLKKNSETEDKEIKETLPKGATIHLKGDFSNLSREDIKQKFNDFGLETAFIAFSKGDAEAYVRLQKEDTGKEFLEKNGQEVEINNSKLEARLLEGEEEETFLKKAVEDKNAYFKKCQQARQGGRKGKGRGRNPRKRKGSPEEESAPAKKATAGES